VAHHHHGALILLQRVFQRLDALHVEMIGGFVEHQQVRVRQRHERQRHARLLSTRELCGAPHDFVAGKSERAEQALDRPPSPRRPLHRDAFVERLVLRYL
jgi:hypothetical protein